MKTMNGLEVLEKHDFEQRCPSFYAQGANNKASSAYQFLNTRDIAAQLWQAGWAPTFAMEQRAVNPENRGFTKHLVRFSHPDYILKDRRVEIVGVNSHNTASSFQLHTGIIEFACSNGIISKSSDFGEFRIRHTGHDVAEQVAAAITGINENIPKIVNKIDQFSEIELTPTQQDAFAGAVWNYIYPRDEKTGTQVSPIRPAQLLSPRRRADMSSAGNDWTRPAPDLWKTFNVVQENALKGGLRGRGSTGRRMSTRRVKSIDKDVKLNRAIWALAETMADLVA